MVEEEVLKSSLPKDPVLFGIAWLKPMIIPMAWIRALNSLCANRPNENISYRRTRTLTLSLLSLASLSSRNQ